MNVMNDELLHCIPEDELLDRIKTCKSPEELLDVYREQIFYQESHLEHFTKRKQELTKPETFNNISNHLKSHSNGTPTTNK
jgi:hypothetical protein